MNLNQTSQFDLEFVLKNLFSSQNKLDGLNDLSNMLASGCSSASFLSQLEKLFQGLRTCLVINTESSNNIEVVVKANQILLDMIGDIQHSDSLEIQFAQLIPLFIENLGSSKAYLRKSTHKCIATYVKLSKKLEFVLLHLNHSGLDNANTRTRQHSMLVIPALLSLKPSIVEKGGAELQEMLSKILKKVRDPQDIVAKTARKLVIELNKCYPTLFEPMIVASLKGDEEKNLCKAILRNDEEEIQKLLNGGNNNGSGGTGPYQSMKKLQEEQKQQTIGLNGSQLQSQTLLTQQTAQNQPLSYAQVFQKNNQAQGGAKELSIVGKEILQSQHGTGALGASMNFGGNNGAKVKDLDKIIYEAKEESRYPKAQNNLYYGFLEESLIEALNENNQWKDRTNAIEAIESKLNIVLLSVDNKMDFLPFATPFLGFILQYIPDINFKISLTTIKIIIKLLQVNLINFKKYYSLLITSLVEKLADSKIVIRQAVLKCCSYIITNYKASTFAFHTMRYLQHGNWHVREGALHLIAHCIMQQSTAAEQSMMTSGQQQQQQMSVTQTAPLPGGGAESELSLPLNPTLISEICSTAHVEDKQKIQSLIVDVLALAIDKSVDKGKTMQLIQKCLGIAVEKGRDESVGMTKDSQLYQLIQERLTKGNLPYINEDGLVEFPSLTPQNHNQSKGGTGITNQMIKQLEENTGGVNAINQETLAGSQNKAPSTTFLEVKRRQEEEKKLWIQQQQQNTIQSENVYSNLGDNSQQDYQQQNGYAQPDKINIWLPSFAKGEQTTGSNQLRMSKDSQMQKPDYKDLSIRYNQDFNDTQSSAANFFDESRSNMTSTTILSSSNKYDQTSTKGVTQGGRIQNNQFAKSPVIYHDEIKLKSEISMSSRQSDHISQSISNNNDANTIGKSPMFTNGVELRLGYTPESHNSKPRQIQSTEIRDRFGSGHPGEHQSVSYNEKTVNERQANSFMGDLNQQKTMSQNKTGQAPAQNFGFGQRQIGSSSSASGNDKLELLRSNSKYKPTSSERRNQVNEISYKDEVNDRFNGGGEYGNDTFTEDPVVSNVSIPSASKNLLNNNNHRMYGGGGGGGPVKATVPLQQYMQTIQQNDDSSANLMMTGSSNISNITPQIQKQKKPPLTQKVSAAQSKVQTRAQSVDNSNPAEIQQNEQQQDANDIYQMIEEPFPNADILYKQALDQLKSGDWAKQFEACSTLKRIALFHKNLLSSSNPLSSTVIKELVKLVDSLRSQLAKNAILCITAIMENIPLKDIDSMIDNIMPTLLKKAADTNAFIQESADKALVSLCFNCSETKVFTCLQQQSNVRSNPMKIKLAMCYNALLEKMGTRIKNFKDSEKLIGIVASFLNEAAIEIRNMAKLGLLQLKSAFGGEMQREFDSLIGRSINNQKLYDKVKLIMEKEDYESICQGAGNNGSTRYGTSMRGSSLDARSAGFARQSPATTNPYNLQQTHSSGDGSSSDGFGKHTATSNFSMMQQTQMKATSNSNATYAGGFNMSGTSAGFKKQAFVSKPIDPMLMEEFKQIVQELGTNDWNKRLRLIDDLTNFVANNQNTIKTAQPSKFIQLIDAYCKLLQDNNGKVQNQAQQSFRIILLNPCVKPLIEQNVSMIVQALNSNIGSNNGGVRDQGEILFNILEGCVEANVLVPPIVAQLNLANNRSKALLIERLVNLTERVDKMNILQKYISPFFQPTNKIWSESQANGRLKEGLARLQQIVQKQSKVLQGE